MNAKNNFHFWWRWLVAADIGVMFFGIAQVLFPNIVRQGFSMMVFGSISHVDTFPQDAIRYITLTHAVMGATMIGWSISMMYTLFTQFRKGEWLGWLSPVTALTLWYIPDTAISITTGFWQNAVLNTVFLILFIIPLAATYRNFKGS